MQKLERLIIYLDMEHLSWGLKILGFYNLVSFTILSRFIHLNFQSLYLQLSAAGPFCQETGNLSTANCDKTDSIQGFPIYIGCCKVGVGETGWCKMRQSEASQLSRKSGGFRVALASQ